ncbi:MAG: MIP/aquaporin family protein [Candidatus Binatia bacterium]
MTGALRQHWPEYLMEAWGLGTFMVSACVFTVLLEHPASPVHGALPDPTLRRVLIGLAMGVTAIGIVYSPWGQQSGAHINPSFTLAFLRLGKVAPWDALFYVLAQFAGAAAGVALSALILGARIADPAVGYAVTVPGAAGPSAAFVAEVAISFGLMLLVLVVSNHARLARFTGVFCGVAVATYIAIEAPLSGMSMNPARTFGSALVADTWTAFWLYLVAPPLGMLLAGELYLRRVGVQRVLCAKLCHDNDKRCIFRCDRGGT